MLREMDSDELTEWQAYDQLEPIGTRRDDYLTALLCMVVSNHIGALGAGKKWKSKSIEDFLIDFDEELGKARKEAIKESKKESTPVSSMQYLVDLNTAMGGVDIRQDQSIQTTIGKRGGWSEPM